VRLGAAINVLATLQSEYEAWRERLPESLEGSEQEGRVTETIDTLSEALDLLNNLQLPRGFGRD
jgi:hypothetical protein